MNKLLNAALVAAIVGVGGAMTATTATAQQQVLNLYSSRHYQTDEALYANFEKATGIKVNRIDGPEDPLIERLKSEGDKSPADLLITVDMGRLLKAQQLGLFQPVKSKLLEEKIPVELRAPDGSWYGFSVRARPIYYAKGRVDKSQLPDYESLADPKWKGKICVRSGNHPYNLSLMSSIIAANGPVKAEAWAKGVVANMARPPTGGDTDQIAGVASGECDLALGNTYYFVRLLKSDKASDRAMAEKVGVIFPNQGNRGAHINISGAGVAKYAPNKANAIKFLEYLASPAAQDYFADGNNEYPIYGKPGNAQLASLGTFKRDPLPMELVGKNYAAAAQIFDRVGWK
jgi:iron(III) transport system substrate-binding protein